MTISSGMPKKSLLPSRSFDTFISGRYRKHLRDGQTLNYRTERPLGSYARWAAARGNVSDPTADLDSDGYNNFFE